MVKIRMSRGGRTHRPIYTIVATDHRSPRDGKFLEKLGQYDPRAEKSQELKAVKADRIKYWVDHGAQMSDTVRTLLKRNQVQL